MYINFSNFIFRAQFGPLPRAGGSPLFAATPKAQCPGSETLLPVIPPLCCVQIGPFALSPPSLSVSLPLALCLAVAAPVAGAGLPGASSRRTYQAAARAMPLHNSAAVPSRARQRSLFDYLADGAGGGQGVLGEKQGVRVEGGDGQDAAKRLKVKRPLPDFIWSPVNAGDRC